MSTTATQSIKLTAIESESSPLPEAFRPGAPNVLVVLLDDLGFAQLGCFGSDVETPSFDRLAERGIRFTNFHTTALCSPTRACLLTGRNHHRVGLGFLPDVPMRFPGYHGRIPAHSATMPEILRESGYATYMVGKWHLTPRDERTPVGPHANWPLGKGFDRFYGFLGGDANHWTPDLICDNSPVDPPARPEDGYHLNDDLADRAIDYVTTLRAHQPDRPFMLYYSTGATHAPHHVAREWADHYAGRFDDGWDVCRERVLERQKVAGVVPEHAELSDRPEWIPAWDDLDADHRKVYARMMEVFAGFLSHTDAALGRVLDHLDDIGELDNTIVVVASDNGASGEGGPEGSVNELRFIENLHEDFDLNLAMIDELGGWRTYGHYPWGWAFAGNTPFRRWKRYTMEGGVRDPLIVSFPNGTDRAVDGTVRAQYCHAIDVLPTVIEYCGLTLPDHVAGIEQCSVDGVSLAGLTGPDGEQAAEVRTTQYYEMWGSRAIYRDGWKAVTDHVNQQHRGERELTTGSSDFAKDRWMLFNVTEDFSERHDLAQSEPDKLSELVALWHTEAERNNVLPLSDGVMDKVAHMDFRWLSGRTRFELAAGGSIHEEAGPSLAGDWSLRAGLETPLEATTEGVLCEQGDWTNGWVWYVQQGELVWVLNYVGESIHEVRAPVPSGARSLGFSFERTEIDGTRGGSGTLYADGDRIGAGSVGSPMPFRFTPNGALLTVGFGRGFPVTDAYRPPFRFTGALDSVVVVTDSADVFDGVRDREIALRHQ